MSGLDEFLSIGIDIGTTTTHIVVSRLHMVNTAKLQEAPRLKIDQREIIHRGGVRFTPITDDGVIDANGVAEIVKAAFAAAKIEPADVRGGAVIITGESAGKRNAEAVVHSLADYAGDFVVASAGPNLESVLSARGSGALEASRETGKTICNVDIGGGTTNVALIYQGHIVETGCLDIGARCLQVTTSGRLISASDFGNVFLLAKTGINPEEPGFLSGSDVVEFALEAANQIFYFVTGKTNYPDLIFTEPMHFPVEPDEYWICGGVAQLMEHNENFETLVGSILQNDTSQTHRRVRKEPEPNFAPDLVPYGDLGPLMALHLRDFFARYKIQYHVPADPIRATVIGAGMHSMQLSGSTIEAANCEFPIKNVPLLGLDCSNLAALEDMIESIYRQIFIHDIVDQQTPVAIYLDQFTEGNLRHLQELSTVLAQIVLGVGLVPPHIFVVSTDVGAALGLLLREHLEGGVIVVDGVDPGEGDYIDIGRPISHSQQGASSIALPVVIKSLVFRK
jgi:ethanolamine utilization protein EutA